MEVHETTKGYKETGYELQKYTSYINRGPLKKKNNLTCSVGEQKSPLPRAFLKQEASLVIRK